MQKTRKDASALRTLFLCADELERLSRLLDGDGDGETNAAPEWRDQKAQARRDLRQGLGRDCPLVLERLFQDIEGRSPEADDLALALLLLNRRIRDGEDGVTGRDLLWILYDNSYDVLAAVPRVSPKSALARAGLLDSWPDPELDRKDPLDAYYALSPRAYARVIGQDDGEQRSAIPFSDTVDAVLSFRSVVHAAERRAAKTFAEGQWRAEYGEPEETLEMLAENFNEADRDYRQRLGATEDSESTSLARFQRERGLDDNDLIIVVALLLHDAFSGQVGLDVLDLVRLISHSDRDFLRKRSHLASGGALLQEGILKIEDPEGERGLGPQVSLEPWVIEQLLVLPTSPERGIAVDERIEFHRYLDTLENSADFFRRLD